MQTHNSILYQISDWGFEISAYNSKMKYPVVEITVDKTLHDIIKNEKTTCLKCQVHSTFSEYDKHVVTCNIRPELDNNKVKITLFFNKYNVDKIVFNGWLEIFYTTQLLQDFKQPKIIDNSNGIVKFIKSIMTKILNRTEKNYKRLTNS